MTAPATTHCPACGLPVHQHITHLCETGKKAAGWTHELATVYNAAGIIVCHCHTPQEAGTIVRAVNSHEDLKAVFAAAKDVVEFRSHGATSPNLWDTLEAAIAKAEARP